MRRIDEPVSQLSTAPAAAETGRSVAVRRRPRRSSPGSVSYMRLLRSYRRSTNRRRTSQCPHPTHQVYRDLIKGMVIERPNQVWCIEITYIPVLGKAKSCTWSRSWTAQRVMYSPGGYRTPRMPTSASRHVAQSLGRYGRPEIFGTDFSAARSRGRRLHRRAEGRGRY